MNLLANLKLFLDLTDSDTELDGKLDLIIEQSKKKVLAYLPNVTLVPDELSYIVLELSVVRFNRIGNEGMTSYSQDGKSIAYGADMSNYEADRKAWLSKQVNNDRGVVRFL